MAGNFVLQLSPSLARAVMAAAGENGLVAISHSGYNNVNQITNRAGTSGIMLFAGGLDKQGTVLIISKRHSEQR